MAEAIDFHASSSTIAPVDPVAALLDGPRAKRAFLLRSLLRPPWSIRVEDEAPLTLVAVVRGAAWLAPDRGAPVRLDPGAVALLRGPDRYTVAGDLATEPQVVILPGQRCATPDGQDLHDVMALGVRTWGNDRCGSTVLLTGTYQLPGEISQRLLEVRPAVVPLPAGGWSRSLLALLAVEIVKDEPGQEAVLDRLLDLLLIAALREWFNRPEAEAPAWYRAHADPVVGPALRLIQHNPAHPWTVASLAAEIGVSRAALARRFRDLVGEPPMSYLTGWRLSLAADLLREPGGTLGAVARQVGYGSPFALSAAFKRVRGVSPRQHRLASA